MFFDHNSLFFVQELTSECLQLLEILDISWNLKSLLEIWNFIVAPGRFNCQLKYDNMPVTEPNLVTSLNPRNCLLTIFVQFYS